MTPLITAIFIASLIGSLHCAGMCGAFIAIAVGDRGNAITHLRLQAAYHGGRLVSYLSLGIAAGIVGRLLDLGGALAGVRSAAAALAAFTVLIFAGVTLVRCLGMPALRGFAPKWMARIAQPVYRMAMTFSPAPRAAVIGLCTTLLPCGWLYAFVATAAGTASVSGAAVTMFVFWLGTLPVMMTIGAGTRALIGPAARRLPILTAVTLVAVSLYTMVGRAAIDPRALARATTTNSTNAVPTPGTAACCKEHVN